MKPMEINEKTVFENISINDAGTGVIVTKRVDEEYARKHAHMMADGYYPTGKGKFFRASNSGFLTAENNHIIVRLPGNN